MYKKAWCTCKVVVFLSFLPFSLPSSSWSLRKLPFVSVVDNLRFGYVHSIPDTFSCRCEKLFAVYYSPLWGCAEDRVEMVLKVYCGTVLGDAFSTWRQIRPPKQSHNAPSRSDLPPNLKVANEWRWHRTGRVVHTTWSHTSNIVPEWLARRIWYTNPYLHFWIFTSVSFRLPSSLLLIYSRYCSELPPLR